LLKVKLRKFGILALSFQAISNGSFFEDITDLRSFIGQLFEPPVRDPYGQRADLDGAQAVLDEEVDRVDTAAQQAATAVDEVLAVVFDVKPNHGTSCNIIYSSTHAPYSIVLYP
jgi:hypothetical protein